MERSLRKEYLIILGFEVHRFNCGFSGSNEKISGPPNIGRLQPKAPPAGGSSLMICSRHNDVDLYSRSYFCVGNG
jgi:hypothetical protein